MVSVSIAEELRRHTGCCSVPMCQLMTAQQQSLLQRHMEALFGTFCGCVFSHSAVLPEKFIAAFHS
jgi:hypothetical protein